MECKIETKTAPLSQSIKEDKSLEISEKEFEKILLETATKKEKQIDQLKSIAPYPEPYIFALFSSKAYLNWHEPQRYKKDELKLPDGWQMLTAAHGLPSDKSWGIYWTDNGYFAVAFWHPERNQIVIAHRGTDLTNLGSVKADFEGIATGEYADVQQVSSAVTFVDKVKTAIRKVKKLRKVRIQLFLTGHSLGGWLAQVTTFSVKYLKLANGLFNLGDSSCSDVIAHTVVFDSPGCENLISKMSKGFDVSNSNYATVSAKSLDVTSYLSAPNRINTLNYHIGTAYRIFVNLTYFYFDFLNNLNYNLDTHSMENILNAFHPRTGQVHEDKNGKPKIKEIVDWPISWVLSRGDIYKEFFKWAKRLNDYDPDDKDENFKMLKAQNPVYHPIRYQTKSFLKDKINPHLLTEEEFLFLRSYCALKLEYPADIETDAILFSDEFFNSESRSMIVEKLATIYVVENDSNNVYSKSAVADIIPFIKNLLQMVPAILENVKKTNLSQALYRFESSIALKRVNMQRLDFAGNVRWVAQFLGDNSKQIMWYEVDKDTEYGIVKLMKTLNKMKRNFFYFLLHDLTERSLWTPQVVLGGNKTILVLKCSSTSSEFLKKATSMIQYIKSNSSAKIIFVSHKNDGLRSSCINLLAQTHLVSSFIGAKEEPIKWDDLSLQSQLSLANEDSLTVHGVKISIKKFLGDESDINQFMQSNPELLKKIIDERPVILTGYEKSLADVDWAIVPIHSEITEEFLINLCTPNVKLYITGIQPGSSESNRILGKLETRNDAITFANGSEDPSTSFKYFCLEEENINNKNYLIHFSNDLLRLKLAYDPALYMQRTLIIPTDIILRDDIENSGNLFRIDDENGLICQDHVEALIASDIRINVNNTNWIELVESSPLLRGKVWGHVSIRRGKFILTQCFDGLNRLLQYIEEVTKYKTVLDEKKFFLSIEGTIAILIDEPGMGKSITSNRLALFNRQWRWVLKINLNKCHDLLSKYKRAFFWPPNLDNVYQFLAKAAAFGPDVDLNVSQQFIRHKLENKNAHWPILFIFDGFDEIRNKENKDRLLYILQVLQKSNVTACLTSRKSDKEMIQNKIPNMEIEFKPLTTEQQRKYLREFWKNWVGLNFSQVDFETFFPLYSDQLLRKAHSLNLNSFIGVPLQVRLMAEGFIKNFIESLGNNSVEPFNDLRVTTIYQSFIQSKLDIFINEKLELSTQMENIYYLREAIVNPFMKIHRYLAWHNMIMGGLELPTYPQTFDDKYNIRESDVSLVGLIISQGRYMDFLHKTIGEYLVAEYIYNKLQKKGNHGSYICIKEKCFTDVWSSPSNRMIRTFLNDLIETRRETLPLFQDFACDHTRWTSRYINLLALHVCIDEGLKASLQSILRYICEDNQRADIFLTKRNSEEFTSLYYAAKYDTDSLTWFLEHIRNFSPDLMRKILLATTFVWDQPQLDPINRNLMELLERDENYELKNIAREVKNKWKLIEQLMIAAYDGNIQKARSILETAQHQDDKDYLILSKIGTTRADRSKAVWCYKKTTPLELALIKNNIEVYNTLLGNASAACRDQIEPVVTKRREESLTKVDRFVRMYKSGTFDRDTENWFHEAAANDDFIFLDAAVSRGVPVDLKNTRLGKDAIQIAEERNQGNAQVILMQYYQ